MTALNRSFPLTFCRQSFSTRSSGSEPTDWGSQAFQQRPAEGTSLSNLVEAHAIVDVLRRLDEHDTFMQWLSSRPEDERLIGIICSYAQQRELIRRTLRTAGISSRLLAACKIDTVDSYQGKENAIVMLSLVRNNQDGQWRSIAKSLAKDFVVGRFGNKEPSELRLKQ